MSKNITFARNLVKGKIAEAIFAQMLRETKEFTVLEFGYEKIVKGSSSSEVNLFPILLNSSFTSFSILICIAESLS